MSHQLAQVNIAAIRAPLDSDIMRDFVTALDEINLLAEGSPGFIWRFKTDSGNATSVQTFPDPRIIVNMSVWRDIAGLKDYTYRSMHGRFFARRAEWFEKMDSPHLALWWIPAGTLPTLEDAKARLQRIAIHGDTPQAFTFRRAFDAAGQALA
jgi:hypothetical protein